MELEIIDISILIIHLIVMIVAGSFMSCKASKDLDSYFLWGEKNFMVLSECIECRGMENY